MSSSSADVTAWPVSISPSSMRLITNVTPGGIDAEMDDLADPVRRLLVAERRVGHLLERGRLDDQLGEGARVDPLDDRGHPLARLTDGLAGLAAEPLLGRPGRLPSGRPRSLASGPPRRRAGPLGRRLGRLPGSLEEAHRASLASLAGPRTTRISRMPPRPTLPADDLYARLELPAKPRPRRSRSPGGRCSAGTTPTSPARPGSSAPSGSTSPTTG